jgi:hypothetical protein
MNPKRQDCHPYEYSPGVPKDTAELYSMRFSKCVVA